MLLGVRNKSSPAHSGKHKMHELYLQFLACRADWSKSVINIRARKEFKNKEVELYEYWTFNKMVTELGEDLAKDLKQRHIEAESKLPENKKGMFIRKRLVCKVQRASCAPGIQIFLSTNPNGATRTSQASRTPGPAA